jgi:hypothetical protein
MVIAEILNSNAYHWQAWSMINLIIGISAWSPLIEWTFLFEFHPILTFRLIGPTVYTEVFKERVSRNGRRSAFFHYTVHPWAKVVTKKWLLFYLNIRFKNSNGFDTILGGETIPIFNKCVLVKLLSTTFSRKSKTAKQKLQLLLFTLSALLNCYVLIYCTVYWRRKSCNTQVLRKTQLFRKYRFVKETFRSVKKKISPKNISKKCALTVDGNH